MAVPNSDIPQIIDRLPDHLSPAAMDGLLSHIRANTCHLLLDGSRVERLDQLGLQILMVLRQTQALRNAGFCIDAPSSALSQGLAFFGLDPDAFTKDAT